MKIVIWDWNGTLLDDLAISIEAMNILLSERRLPLLQTNYYKQVFTFPVKDYYQTIGFDFDTEPFEKPAIEYMDRYFELLPQAPLHKNTIAVLDWLKKHNIKQIIMSAMEQSSLDKSVAALGISSYFDAICGCSNHYANGKVEQSLQMMRSQHIKPDEALLVGDTLHDSEVAQNIGCRCVLVAHGHQCAERLHTSGNAVVADFKELIGWLETSVNNCKM